MSKSSRQEDEDEEIERAITDKERLKYEGATTYVRQEQTFCKGRAILRKGKNLLLAVDTRKKLWK